LGKAGLDIGIDPELLAQAKRLGISIAGMSESQARLHLQKVDPAGAEERARRWTEENAEAIKAYRNGSRTRRLWGRSADLVIRQFDVLSNPSIRSREERLSRSTRAICRPW
jgi:antitoxin CcdA